MRLTNRELRQRVEELSALMCEWDPTGVVAECGAPPDEYDCLVGPLLALLQSGATEVEIEGYLRQRLVEHFGLSCDPQDVATVAGRVRRWFNRSDS
jgi:hypothetical protein